MEVALVGCTNWSNTREISSWPPRPRVSWISSAGRRRLAIVKEIKRGLENVPWETEEEYERWKVAKPIAFYVWGNYRYMYRYNVYIARCQWLIAYSFFPIDRLSCEIRILKKNLNSFAHYHFNEARGCILLFSTVFSKSHNWSHFFFKLFTNFRFFSKTAPRQMRALLKTLKTSLAQLLFTSYNDARDFELNDAKDVNQTLQKTFMNIRKGHGRYC